MPNIVKKIRGDDGILLHRKVMGMTDKDYIMEYYFDEDIMERNKEPCEHYCSFCTGRVNAHAGKFKKDAVVNCFLATCLTEKLLPLRLFSNL